MTAPDHRSHVTPGAAWALAGAAVWCGPGLAVHWPPMARALGVPLRSDSSDGVALTFDDGPHPEGTPAVLEALRTRGAKATFFLVAEQVERHRSLVDEILAEGHRPAIHAHRHRNQMRLGPRAFAADLDRAMGTIGEACRRAPNLYRPPYGVFTPAGLVEVRRRRLEPLLWSKWGRDWRADRRPATIAAQATAGLTGGDVILLHDADWYSAPGSHRNTAAAMPLILDELERLGLAAVLP
ncbi:MAG TPA: polysaccharide deacetylase family protein [Solirubrobacteraceae bacterium]|jgi:peptidoglycan/xylan/chitin deacetylase (PgdA/CDA1 family)